MFSGLLIPPSSSNRSLHTPCSMTAPSGRPWHRWYTSLRSICHETVAAYAWKTPKCMVCISSMHKSWGPSPVFAPKIGSLCLVKPWGAVLQNTSSNPPGGRLPR